MRDLLGGKGAGLAAMTNMLIPVPPGFTITTSACRYYMREGSLPIQLESELTASLRWLEESVGKKFNESNETIHALGTSGHRSIDDNGGKGVISAQQMNRFMLTLR
jgi:pyruvate,orthophosphate dikinase